MATLKELFEAYRTSDNSVTDAKDALEQAMHLRSAKVEAIVKVAGKGPFQFNGKTVTAAKRATKDEAGNVTGTTWFFKSIGDDVQVIE